MCAASEQHTIKPFGLPRAQIMRAQKAIEELFHKSSSSFLYPYKAVYCLQNSNASVSQVLFVVPKKQFRKAHERNRIRRLMREAYRLLPVESRFTRPIQLGLIYVGKKEEDLAMLQKRMQKLCVEISKQILDLE